MFTVQYLRQPMTNLSNQLIIQKNDDDFIVQPPKTENVIECCVGVAKKERTWYCSKFQLLRYHQNISARLINSSSRLDSNSIKGIFMNFDAIQTDFRRLDIFSCPFYQSSLISLYFQNHNESNVLRLDLPHISFLPAVSLPSRHRFSRLKTISSCNQTPISRQIYH